MCEIGFDGVDAPRERRIALLLRRLPPAPRRWIGGLRRSDARTPRIAIGLLLTLGGLLSILPLLGLWMLPLGLLLLAEDVAPLRRLTGRVLGWIEQRHPRWMGLPQ